ncbi:hypothetical protein [Anaerosolibacter sp.]|uniref:hypothetical protein n=1 Tax=Anaerosolibacter sp. TaxID=1872527 RepID=UPI0039EE77B8
MKQHISNEQLKVLSWEEQKKIATIFGQFGNCSRNDANGDEYLILPMLAEKITIGKMIEVITKDNITVDIKTTTLDTEDGKKAFILLNNIFNVKSYSSEELCDALWEAVKEIVN